MGVLDDMTKGITERKAKAAGPKLTPVGTEASPTKPSMPKDVPGTLLAAEELQAQAASLREYAARLTAVADGLDVLAGVPEASMKQAEREAVTAAKLAEKEADRRVADQQKAAAGDTRAAARVMKADEETAAFAADFAAKQAAAQAAVFTSLDAGEDDEPATPAPATGGWTCPSHGTKDLVRLTSRTRREYSACNIDDCNRFEK